METSKTLISKALEFASLKHKGQKRKGSGLPYVIHPILVMENFREHYECIIKESTSINHFEKGLITCLLHDTLEDTDCTFEEIKNIFGEIVASMVKSLTNNEDELKKLGKNEYMKRKIVELKGSVFSIKLSDRLSNIQDLPTLKYCLDTLELMDYIEEKVFLIKSDKKVISLIKLECELQIKGKK